MGDLAGCGDCPGGVDVGGDWARWGEGQRCVGRGSEEGCGSSEWTGVRVPKCRRPVGREGSLGQNSRWRIPLPSGASRGPLPSVFPVIVQNPERAHLGLGWKEFSGIPRTGGGKKMQAQITTSLLASHPPPSSKGAGGKTEGRPSLAAGKPDDLCSLPSLSPAVRDTGHFVTFLKQS